MKQSLKNPSCDEENFVPDALTSGDGVESPLAAGAEASEKGRVLLLDDDSAFREVIKDCLVENGYAVVAIQNGGEGVREILAGDFTMVLCDFMMPGLPGDMFYRAVERIRPALCQRFVFMTGHQNDARTNEFIKSFDGLVLRKPFPLKNLLDSLALAEVRQSFLSVFDGVPTDPDGSRVCQLADSFPASGTLSAEASSVARILARAPTKMGLDRRSDVTTASEPELRASGGSRSIVFAGLAILLFVTAVLWNRFWDARDGVTAASAERRTREAEWAALSPDLEAALAVRSKVEAEQRQRVRISADRKTPRWTPALHGILLAPEAGIELLEVQARGAHEESGSGEVRLHGVAGGPEPRAHADRFRQAVEDEVRKSASGRAVNTRFERLEDVPGAQPDQKQAEFFMNVTIGATERPAAAGEEGR